MGRKPTKSSNRERKLDLDSFVTSSVNELGIGKLLSFEHDEATVSYFKSPATDFEIKIVPRASLGEARLEAEMRVYWREGSTGNWLVGRLQTPTPVTGTSLAETEERAETDRNYMKVRFPNGRVDWIPVTDLEIRWTLPIENPVDLLATRTQESPYWNEGRAKFTASLASQRALYGGLSGLASASIELFSHQVRVVKKVLKDPIQRYLLADEVGLGKTIEAGVILKQHLLDNPLAGSVVVVVPEHLKAQWTGELVDRFHLNPFIESDRLNIISHDEVVDCEDVVGQATFLVVDEAHRFSSFSGDSDELQSSAYDILCHTASQINGVLLLSATPVLKNERAFLAMLHLLDPETFRLQDIERFRKLVQEREFIGEIVRTLQDDADEFFLEPALGQLGRLCGEDERLAELVNEAGRLVEQDEEDEDRVSAIRALRIHLQESYRLHRRIIRTRRDDETVADDLPSRDCIVEFYDDPVCDRASEFLDRWRVNATLSGETTAKAVGVFSEFIEALFSAPRHLAEAICKRVRELEQEVAVPFFEDELLLLREAVPFLTEDQGSRVKAIAESIVAQCRKGRRCVLFVDKVDDAQSLFDKLARLLGKKSIRRFDSNQDLADFQSATHGVQLLVCDHRHEEGLNLQKLEVSVVHADLPFSINRIEQRIGRIDRLGARSVSRSVVIIPKGSYLEAWALCLVEVVRVFERSVAPLQYLLREASIKLMTSLFELGVEAIEELNIEFSATEGPLSLEHSLAKIRAQEALDALDSLGGDFSEFFSRLESYEYGKDSKRFQHDLEAWAVENLVFGVSRGKDKTNYRYQGLEQRRKSEVDKWIDPVNEGPRTLLSPTSFHNLFSPFGTCSPLTHGSYSRRTAEETGMPLFRIGHPFVDGLSAELQSDERGIAYALWRQHLGYSSESFADLYFRFDFMIETNLAGVKQTANEFSGISVPSLQRRADEVFAPFFSTVWLDPDLVEVESDNTLAILRAPYKSQQSKDTSLRAERWEHVETLLSLANWYELCGRADRAARRILGDSSVLNATRERALTSLEERFSDDRSILVSRISRLNGPSKISEEKALEMETAIFDGLRDGISSPLVRLSSVGAIFLSSQSPFDEGGQGSDE